MAEEKMPFPTNQSLHFSFNPEPTATADSVSRRIMQQDTRYGKTTVAAGSGLNESWIGEPLRKFFSWSIHLRMAIGKLS
jgi:hypothetical protein